MTPCRPSLPLVGKPATSFLCGTIVATLLTALLGGAALAAPATRPPNVLFLAIDDLRPALGALGAAEAQTPMLDTFARTARIFTHHYAQVPTCGASRCALLRGSYPSEPEHVSNNAILTTQARWGDANLPGWFRRHGYQTLALGKITHYPGGRTGRNWSEGPEELPNAWDRSWIPDTPWKHAEGIMHGFANGRARVPGGVPAFEAFDGPDTAYPDAWVAAEAVGTLRTLAQSDKPWFFAVGLFKPHLPFSAPKRYFDLHRDDRSPDPVVATKPQGPSGWHPSNELRRNYAHGGRDPDTDPEYARTLRTAYAAATSYVDAQAGRVLDALQELGLADNTIVVVWGDHGFLLGEHAIWGKHCLYEKAVQSVLMIRSPGLPHPGKASSALVETVDLFPTLADLCRLPAPAGLDGHSLRPQLAAPDAPTKKPALGFWTQGQRTVRTDRWRLIVHPSDGTAAPGYELFDFNQDSNEARNVAAEQPAVVASLVALLPAPLASAPAAGKARSGKAK
ncbi:sulfatase [Horticoccus sp. 23ND18S-11]|uniref:sulfatase n=1 Tax=Horticoccus sp. 23ND18S-11 TaxID=3391832 RepID=UPI0039C9C229